MFARHRGIVVKSNIWKHFEKFCHMRSGTQVSSRLFYYACDPYKRGPFSLRILCIVVAATDRNGKGDFYLNEIVPCDVLSFSLFFSFLIIRRTNLTYISAKYINVLSVGWNRFLRLWGQSPIENWFQDKAEISAKNFAYMSF